MTVAQAKQVLLLYRPESGDVPDPELAEALEVARENPELRAWFDEHCDFQTAMRRKFQEIQVPAELKTRIEAAEKILRPRFRWRRMAWPAAAAAAVLVLGLTLAVKFTRLPVPDRFADYRARMVRTALREYRMDITTNDMSQVRSFMAARGAPADYALTAGLERLQLTGGGLLRWRSHPVAMVCFDRGDRQMLFLFVMDRTAVVDSPSAAPQLAKVNKLITASWTRDDKTYVLAGPEDAEFLRKYF